MFYRRILLARIPKKLKKWNDEKAVLNERESARARARVCVCVWAGVGACLCFTPIQLLKLSVSLSETCYGRCGSEMTYGNISREDKSHYTGINLVEP
jgi:hypothetical protein